MQQIYTYAVKFPSKNFTEFNVIASDEKQAFMLGWQMLTDDEKRHAEHIDLIAISEFLTRGI